MDGSGESVGEKERERERRVVERDGGFSLYLTHTHTHTHAGLHEPQHLDVRCPYSDCFVTCFPSYQFLCPSSLPLSLSLSLHPNQSDDITFDDKDYWLTKNVIIMIGW